MKTILCSYTKSPRKYTFRMSEADLKKIIDSDQRKFRTPQYAASLHLEEILLEDFTYVDCIGGRLANSPDGMKRPVKIVILTDITLPEKEPAPLDFLSNKQDSLDHDHDGNVSVGN